jgi:hypothetical protein
MAESLALTTPIGGTTAIATLRPSLVILDPLAGRVTVQVREWTGSAYVQDGRFREFTWDGASTPTGQSLIVSLNKANLSTISLEKRIMQQIVASFPAFTGTISGAAD